MARFRFKKSWLSALRWQLLGLLLSLGFLLLGVWLSDSRLRQAYLRQNAYTSEVYTLATHQLANLQIALSLHLGLWAQNLHSSEADPVLQKEKQKLKARELWQKQLWPAQQALEKAWQKINSEDKSTSLLAVRAKLTRLYRVAQKAFTSRQLPEIFQLQLLPLTEELVQILEEMQLQLEIDRVAQGQIFDYDRQYWFIWRTVLLISALLLGALGGFWFYQRVRLDLNHLRTFGLQLAQGNLPANVRVKYRELGGLAVALNVLRNALVQLRQYAESTRKSEELAQQSVFPLSSALGKALQNLQSNLSQLSRETEQRAWINQGIAQLSDILTRYADNLDRMLEVFVADIAQYLGVNQVGVFVHEKENETNFLELKSAFAYQKKRFLEKRIFPGQGLVGQTWLEGELMYLREIPPDYVSITSGLGEARPACLLLAPLTSNAGTQGVLEMAAFEELPDFKIELVRKLAETLGQNIAASRTNQTTKALLVASQALTQDLQTKEEQMRQNMYDLQLAQRQMHATQRELSYKEANLDALINNTSHAILAYDKNYQITVVNRAMRQLYRDLRVGQNLLEALPAAETQQYRHEYEQALEGKKFEILRHFVREARPVIHERHYNPIINEDKEVIGASIFIEDITEQKLAENRLKQTQSHLYSLINDTEDLILALDKEYRLIIFNEVCENTYRRAGFDLQLGQSIFQFHSTKEMRRWQALYDRALEGERFVQVMDTGKFPNKTYREYWFNPIRDEEEQVTGLSIFSRDITEAKQSEMRIRQLLLESLEATETLKSQEESMKKRITEYEDRIQDLQMQIAEQAEKFPRP
ncbi:MAG: PAS domain-containing protein [Microscillaceae bacterium]|nr:PAS domain-containing protein [Microscillaceae bacterium]